MRHVRAKSIFPGRVRGWMVEFKRERFIAETQIAQNPQLEYKNFRSAMRAAQLQLVAEKKIMLDRRREAPHEMAALDDAIEVLESHILTLEDPYFLGEIKKRIFTTGATAAAAVGTVIGAISRQFMFDSSSGIVNGQNRHFIQDMNDMKRRILYFLGIQQEFTLPQNVSIVAAAKLTVSEVLALKRAGVKGIVIGETSETAHEMIMLRAMRIPCVSVSNFRFFRLRKQVPAIIDADIGYIVLRPHKNLRFTESPKEETPLWSTTVKTKSGEKVQLSGTLHFTSELNTLDDAPLRAQKIGIYRTEYQISEAGELPSTRQLIRHYEYLLTHYPKTEITFRLFDFSDDKNFLKSPRIEKKPDLRGIRFLLVEKKILESQLHALIKAAESTQRSIRILVPYLSETHELNSLLHIINGFGLPKNQPTIHLGAMLETPASIFTAPRWLKDIDFFYVGTSDLLSALSLYNRSEAEAIQRALFSDASAALFNQLKKLSRKKPLTLCGEIVGEPWAVAYLRHFEFNNFVVPVHRIATIVNILQALTKETCAHFVRQITKLDDETKRLEKARALIRDILYGQS
ncbi:MAG TPA: phosphoenolpyruvate-utilizing N-terminal domain-containing protein [Turneriella sp.]|nr:phosphoenolpyruvate-utilizing N-terminal domain-containing protein [Turneriella sp.]